MADVQTGAARVWEHVEHVELRLTRIEVRFAGIGRVKCAGLIPDRLPLRLQAIERIRFAALATHRNINLETRNSGKETKIFLDSWFPDSFRLWNGYFSRRGTDTRRRNLARSSAVILSCAICRK